MEGKKKRVRPRERWMDDFKRGLCKWNKKQVGNGQRQYRMENTVLETKVYKGMCAGGG